MRAAFILAAITFAAPLSASDVNAYRNGQAYMTTAAPSPMVCEMQCSGDAQCRSWNFLPPRMPRATGLCELNATAGQAMSHPFAISGAAAGAQQSYDRRVIAAGTRTTRIGQPASAPAPQPRMIRQAVRRPMPVEPRQAIRPAAPQAAPQFQRAAAPRVQMPRPIVRQRRLAPAPRPQVPNQSAPLTAPQAPALSLTEQQNLQRAATRNAPPAPTLSAPQPAQMMQRPAPAPIPAGGFAPLPIQDQAHAPAMDRLYGSLYDDTAPKKVKMPLYSQRPANDPDAPVVTTVPAPTTPVRVDSLPMAGGPL